MIVIYGTSICPTCDKAKQMANDYGLRWTFKDVSNREVLSEFMMKFPGENKVPQIVWHDRVIGGYNEFVSEIENTRNYGDGKI